MLLDIEDIAHVYLRHIVITKYSIKTSSSGYYATEIPIVRYETYLGNIKHGDVIEFYAKNGNTYSEYKNRFGLMHGVYVSWYETGEIYEKRHYKRGRLNGLYLCWGASGQVIVKCIYKNHILVDDFETHYFHGR